MKFFVYLCVFFLSRNCFASDSLIVRSLGIEQGLSNNAVTCIYQDHNGFMWFGTYDGLNNYDGNSFHVFRNIIGDSTSLLDNHIYCINSDSENKIWVGGSKGVSVYDQIHAVFFTPRFQKNNSSKLIPLHDEALVIKNIGSSMLVGTARNGLIVFNNNNKIGKQISIPEKGDASYTASAIEYDSIKHEIWIFINDLGLYKYDINTDRIFRVASSITQCICMYVSSSGNLFVGNDSGIFWLQKNTFVHIKTFPEITIRRINEDPKHELWIATDGYGLWHSPEAISATAHFHLATETINSNSIYDICFDAEGNAWVGTLRGGVSLIEKNNRWFKTIEYRNTNVQDADDFILSFCEDENSNVWIGTDGAGMHYWDKQKNTFTKYIHSADKKSVSSNFVTSIVKDYKNSIWISTWFGTIDRLNKSSNTFSHYNCYNPVQKINEKNVWQLFEDSKKHLWACVGNNKGHLYLYDRDSDKFLLFDTALINFQVLTQDNCGDLWGGTPTSIIKVDPEKRKHKTFFIGYPVRSIYEDKMHNFWIGTEGGGLILFDRESGKFNQITTKEGLPNNDILRILEDKMGNLWMSTYDGLCRYNYASKAIRNFTQADGLQSNQFSFNAAMVSKRGEFLFGGIKGFNIFFPDSINDKQIKPQLFLTEIKIDNVSIGKKTSFITSGNKNIINEITIPYDKANVSLDFVALQYSNASNLQYAYFLKGWDKNWNISNNNKIANYAHLTEGEYKFYLKVINKDNSFNNEVLLLTIKVLPPWYRASGAFLFYAFLIMAAIYFFLYYYRCQQRLRNEIKNAVFEKQKEKETTEKKIAFFTHVSHELRTPLTLILNPLKEIVSEMASEKIQKKLVTIQRNAKRLLSLVDRLLLFRKAESLDQHLCLTNFDLKEVCNDVFSIFSDLASYKKINFIFHTHADEILFFGDKEKIEIILFNLISNALKYTPENGEVKLFVSEHETNVQIVVNDTGCGIATDINNKLFDDFYQADNSGKASESGFGIGLYISQKLAVAHNGQLSYTSKEGEGTSFTLILPINHVQSFKKEICEVVYKRTNIVYELAGDLQEYDFLVENKIDNNKSKTIDKIVSGLPTMVIADDDAELRNYIKEIFKSHFNIYEADDGIPALDLINKELPDIVISDLIMIKMDGIELCRTMKANPSLAHIPVILLTSNLSEQLKIQGIEYGIEDCLNKPFSKELIIARVANILESRNRLREYFFNTVTRTPTASIDLENKIFLEECIKIVEQHIDDAQFSVEVFCKKIGMSHPALYKKIKAVSGLTVNVFIRYLRLRNAAELLITTSKTITEVAYITGFNDIKYFREQFTKLFGITPSKYIKQYRKPFGNQLIKISD